MNDKIKLSNINSKGFGIIPKMVMQDKELHVIAKGIYAYFCSFAGSGDSCFPTRSKMCYDLGITNETLGKYIKQLSKKGYIFVDQIKEKGKFSHNMYTLNDTFVPCTKITVTDETEYGEIDTNINSIKNNNYLKETYIKDIVEQSSTTYPFSEIVDYLNEKAETQYRASSKKTKTLIKARIDERFTLEDFKTVIDKKVDEWKSDKKMSVYLRPETLFGNKFEGYLNSTTKEETKDITKENYQKVAVVNEAGETYYVFERTK